MKGQTPTLENSPFILFTLPHATANHRNFINEKTLVNLSNIHTMNEYTITPEGYPSITVKVTGLCDECKVLGYCRLSNNQLSNKKFTFKDYLNLVPAHFYGGKMCKYSKFHLQVACDAFHQEDYETAILNFRAVLEADNYYDAIIGLAVAYFMVKDYDNAAIFTERCSTSYTPAIIESLKDDIAKLAIENATVKEKAITETAVNAIEKQTTKLALVY